MRKKRLMTLILLLLTILLTSQIATAATKAPKKIKLNKTKVKLYVGDTLKLKVKVTPSSAKKTVKWTSSNKKVVTVSAKGKIKAKAPGKAVITCTSKVKKSVKAKCTVTVKKKSSSGGGSGQSGAEQNGSDQSGADQSNNSGSGNEPKKTIQQLDAETLANAKTIITLNGDALNTWFFGQRGYSKKDGSGNMIWSIVENNNGTINYINLYKPGTNELLACTDVINNYSEMSLCSDTNGDDTMYLMSSGQYDFANDPDGALVSWNYWGCASWSSEGRTKAKLETMFNGKISDEIYNKLMGYVDYPVVSGKGKELFIIYGKNTDGVLTARYAGYYIYKDKRYGLIGVAADNPNTYGKDVYW